MSKPKPQTVQLPTDMTNEYAWEQAPSWQEFEDAKNFQFNDDLLAPAVDAQYDQSRDDLEDSLNSAFAGNLSEAGRARILAAEGARINNDRSTALAQGQYQRNQQDWEKQKFVTALRAPQMVNKRSYGYGTQQAQQQQGGLLNTAITAGATILGSFL